MRKERGDSLIILLSFAALPYSTCEGYLFSIG
jgi:hypothetical protein